MKKRDYNPTRNNASSGKKLRILFVSSFLPEYKLDGGISAHMSLLRRELEKQGHTVFHLASVPDHKFTQQSTKNTSLVSPALRKRVPFRFHLNMIRKYRDAKKIFSPDIIHIHSMSGLSLLVYEKKIPVFVTIHSLSTPLPVKNINPFFSWAYRGFRFLDQRNQCYFLKSIFRNASRVLLVSEKTKKEVFSSCNGLKSTNAEVLSPGIDLNRFCKHSSGAAKRKLGLEKKFILLFVGRMVEAKRPLNIIQALPIVLETYPDTFAMLIGNGPDFTYCEQKTRELGLVKHVQFIRGIANRELPLYYNAADIFINPTGENETFGLATAEAMACGIPVVISREGSSTGVVTGEEAVIYDNVTELSSSIMKLRQNVSLRQQIVDRGTKLVKTYSSTFTIKRLSELYEEYSSVQHKRKLTRSRLLFFMVMVLLNCFLDSVKNSLRKPTSKSLTPVNGK
jgi:1,2-diacylglycerol 3-alpha-glucosyltransferase